jgi:hypothetical protein
MSNQLSFDISGPQLTHHAIDLILTKLWAPRFDVRLVHEDGAINHPIVRTWKSRNLTNPNTIRFLRAKNAQGIQCLLSSDLL